jgi:hypothetical protein
MSAPRGRPSDPLGLPEATLFDGRRLITGATAASAVGLTLTVVAIALDPRAAAFSWLIAIAFVVTIAVGALIFLLSCNAMNATWPTLVRRLCESVAAPIPALGALFVPVAAAMGTLFPWARPGAQDPALRELLAHKAPYLNEPFFVARAIVYFAFWGAVIWRLRGWSLARDADLNHDAFARARVLSAACLPALAITFTLASFDWLMSLTPAWFSTMYGVYVFAGGFVAAIALVTLLAHAADAAGILPGMSPSHYHALGRLLLAFTVFWAYAGFFQFMIIWIANKPVEVPYYLARNAGGFKVVSVVLVVLSFHLKRDGRKVAIVSGWIVAMHYLDVHWLVAPAAREPGAPFHIGDLGALLAVGGASVVVGALLLRGRSVVPRNDPRLAEALKYEAP